MLGRSNNTCSIGSLGANCESCDLYNQTGNGNFGKASNFI